MSKHVFSPEFDQLPDTLPIFPLTGAIVLPFVQLPLNIFEKRYLTMIFDALSELRMIGMIQPKSPDEDAIYPIGCAGRISSFQETDDGRLLISLSGLCRFKVQEEIPSIRGYRRVIPNWKQYAEDYFEDEVKVNTAELIATLNAFFKVARIEADIDALKILPGPQLINFMATNLPFEPTDKQALLEANTLLEREKILMALAKATVTAASLSQETLH
ncbi:MAG: LON peptidase substrate-binding domain-containing protein [Candidatus Competibacteraceae bacterium]|jgi:Lon protease-like protein|nr:LON peptidase substrate-binding domain-containing protein [Candidatus Competibacteraceae bacterium]